MDTTLFLTQILIHLRTLHFYAQDAHHRTHGPSFYGDHAALGDLYESYAEAFDTLAELAIGLRMPFRECEVNMEAAKEAHEMAGIDGGNADHMFRQLGMLEKELRESLVAYNDATGSVLGLQNVVAQFHQDSLHRAGYKIGQRVRLQDVPVYPAEAEAEAAEAAEAPEMPEKTPPP